ncbi:sensor histidine kinase [Vibrio coralliilyticus]
MNELLLVSQNAETPSYFSEIEFEQTENVKQAKTWLRSHKVGVVILDVGDNTQRYIQELESFLRSNLKNYFVALWAVSAVAETAKEADRTLSPDMYRQDYALRDIQRELRKQRAVSKRLQQNERYLNLLTKINKFNRSNASPNQVMAEFVNELNAFCGARQTYLLRDTKKQESELLVYQTTSNDKLKMVKVDTECSSLWRPYLSMTKPDIKFSELEEQPHALVFPVWILDKHSCTIVCLVDKAQAEQFTFSKIKILEEAAVQLKIILENLESQRRMRHNYQRLKSSLSELNMAKEQLVHSEKMASLGRLTAGIAHEINNPLGVALGNFTPLSDYTEAIMNLLTMHDDFIDQLKISGKADVPENIKDFKKQKDVSFIFEDLSSVIQDSQASLLRVKSIVSDLSSLSRGVQSEREPCSLKVLCDEVIKIHCYDREQQPLVENFIASDVVIETSPTMLHLALSNLHLNALDAVRERGKDAKIIYRCEVEPAQIRLTLEDNGCGIGPEDLHIVFEPFYTTKPVGDGRGMGLTVALNAINGLGGELTLNSDPSTGTQAVIVFSELE